MCHKHYCVNVYSNPLGELAKTKMPDLIMVNELNCGALSLSIFYEYFMEFCLNLMVDRLETWGKEREGGGFMQQESNLRWCPKKTNGGYKSQEISK